MKLLISSLAAFSLSAGLPAVPSAQAAPLHAAAPAQTLAPFVAFDGATNEFPEALAIDHRGNIYVSLVFAGRIKKVSPQGVQSDFAEIPDGFLLGMTFDRAGNLVVLGANGIWKVSQAGVVTLFAAVPGHSFLNDLVYDRHGNLYVTDSTGYLIWKIDPQGNATTWSTDPLLQSVNENFPYPLGPNGIRFSDDQRTLHVANTSAGTLLAIDVRRDGSAGRARIIASDPALIGADGIEIDDCGNTYVAVNIQNRIARVSPYGSVTTVVEGGLLATPTALIFGSGRDARSLLIVNNGNAFFSSTPEGQGLVRLGVENCHHGRRGCD